MTVSIDTKTAPSFTLNDCPLLKKFPEALKKALSLHSRSAGSSDGFHSANTEIRPMLRSICSSLQLPGSGAAGLEHLSELADKAQRGEPGLVLSWHASNMDVPHLETLLHQAGRQDLFDRLLFIAGRKLHEESHISQALASAFQRLNVSPPSFLRSLTPQTPPWFEAQAMNRRAFREARKRMKQGDLLFLFPTGTRYREGRPETAEALPQVAGYLRMAKNVVFLKIHGNTLIPQDKKAMHKDPVRHDVVQAVFSPVHSVEDLMKQAQGAERQSVARLVMQKIQSLPAIFNG